MKRSFLKHWASFFALYGILFIPFPFFITRIQYTVTGFLFGGLTRFVSEAVFGKTLKDSSIYSDSTSMYALVLVLALIALVTVMVLRCFTWWQRQEPRVLHFIFQSGRYYLALQLLKYGVDKLFLNQFYQPEPNILFTRVGDLDKDILYWTSMGTSSSYSVFMGVLETVAAFLLLSRKTILIGLLVSLAVMVNVVAVNFGFDIGVKLFSLFLLFLTLLLLQPYARKLYLFLTEQPVNANANDEKKGKSFFRYFFKYLLVGIIVLETVYPFFEARLFNRSASQQQFHGAYEVREMIKGADTLTTVDLSLKRLFVHSKGYMIFQDPQDRMQDFKLDHDGNTWMLIDYDKRVVPVLLDFNPSDSILLLKYKPGADSVTIKAKSIEWKTLPALQKGFHWTVD